MAIACNNWVIYDPKRKKFVNKDGAFTKSLKKAELFKTRDEVRAHKVDNEKVLKVRVIAEV